MSCSSGFTVGRGGEEQDQQRKEIRASVLIWFFFLCCARTNTLTKSNLGEERIYLV